MVLKSISQPFEGWKGWIGLAVGIGLVSLGLMPRSFSVSKIFLGVVCVFISGVKKTVSLDEKGLEVTISVWKIKKTLSSSWNEIESLSIDDARNLLSVKAMGKVFSFVFEDGSKKAVSEMIAENRPVI